MRRGAGKSPRWKWNFNFRFLITKKRHNYWCYIRNVKSIDHMLLVGAGEWRRTWTGCHSCWFGWSLALRAFTLYLLVSLITVHCQSRRWQARHVAKSQLTGKSWLLCNPNKLLRAQQRDQKNGTWNNKKVILTAQCQGERIIDQIYCPGFCPHSSAGASWIEIEEGCVSKRFTCWDVFIERVKKKNFRKWAI